MRCPERTTIIRYFSPGGVGSEMSPEARHAVERHLAVCTRCAHLGEVLAPAASALGLALAVAPDRRPECPDHADLTGYLKEDLPRRRRDMVRSHLLGCEACLRRTHLLGTALPGGDAGRILGCSNTVRGGRWVPA